MDKEKKIIEWLSTHPFFSLNGMCKFIGLDTSNLTKVMSKGRIPEKHIDKIEKVIKKYGYNS